MGIDTICVMWLLTVLDRIVIEDYTPHYPLCIQFYEERCNVICIPRAKVISRIPAFCKH